MLSASHYEVIYLSVVLIINPIFLVLEITLALRIRKPEEAFKP